MVEEDVSDGVKTLDISGYQDNLITARVKGGPKCVGLDPPVSEIKYEMI